MGQQWCSPAGFLCFILLVLHHSHGLEDRTHMQATDICVHAGASAMALLVGQVWAKPLASTLCNSFVCLVRPSNHRLVATP